MTDAEYEAIKARIDTLYGWWGKALGLRWWHVKLVWNRQGFENAERGRGFLCAARGTTHWAYLEANIEWNLPALIEQTDDELERTVVHECMHILVAELVPESEDMDRKHEERVCTLLSKAFIWVRDMTAEAQAAHA